MVREHDRALSGRRIATGPRAVATTGDGLALHQDPARARNDAGAILGWERELAADGEMGSRGVGGALVDGDRQVLDEDTPPPCRVQTIGLPIPRTFPCAVWY